MQATKQAHSNFLVSPLGRWRTIATLPKGANGRLRRQRPFEKKSSKETLLGCYYHLILHQIEGRHLLPSSSSTVYTGLVAALWC